MGLLRRTFILAFCLLLSSGMNAQDRVRNLNITERIDDTYVFGFDLTESRSAKGGIWNTRTGKPETPLNYTEIRKDTSGPQPVIMLYRQVALGNHPLNGWEIWVRKDGKWINSSAQDPEWFCPGCGKSGNKGNFCPACGYRRPFDDVLFFDNMQSGNPSDKWCVAELKDFENSGLGIDGTLKVEYSGQPEVLYATRQGCKVIDTTPVKCKSTWTRLHWDAFHEHSREETSVDEKVDYGALHPAINGHPLFVPENYTIEFDMYLFTPASGPRKNDSEDWCFVNFCGHEFMINTWGKEFYNMFLVGGGSPAVKVTEPGWRHFELRYINGHADLLLDGEWIAGCPEQHRKEGGNHVGFHAGTNPKFFCVRNVKIRILREAE